MLAKSFVQRVKGSAPLNGVIHAAGILHDSFLLKKEFGDFVDVLRPKVHGVAALDEATSDESIDFFALFSSTAGAFGNAGQSDYAYAMDFWTRLPLPVKCVVPRVSDMAGPFD